MAEIHVERKETSIWPWILGLLLLLLLAWGIYEMMDDDVEEPVAAAVVPPAMPGPVPADPPPAEPIAQGPLTLADLMASPATAFGRPVALPEAVRVAEVPSDRGFWVEDQGQRVFIVLNEGAAGTADVEGQQAERPVLRPGDIIQVTEAVAHDPTRLEDLQGTIDPATRQILSNVPVFLVTDARNIQTRGPA